MSEETIVAIVFMACMTIWFVAYLLCLVYVFRHSK